MNAPRSRIARLIAVLLLSPLGAASAQSLAQRVESAPEGGVSFSFAAAEGVCGDGRTFISVGRNMIFGSFTGTADARERCEPGPVRVELSRSGRTITSIATTVGPGDSAMAQGTSLGTVPAPEAAEYLLSLAARLEGRPSKDAIFPAMLAEGANPWPRLLAIARDQNRPRETRRSAISWMSRAVGASRTPPSTVVAALVALARAGDDNLDVRKQAVSALSRVEDPAGVDALMAMAGSTGDLWLAKEAASSLSRAGDPRARQFLRAVLRQPNAHEEILEIAIRGLGGSYATGEDAALLRETYARLAAQPPKERVIASLGSIGGRENVQWLLTVAGNSAEPVALRRRALQAANKAEAPIGDFVSAYGRMQERELKQELIDIYSRRPETAGTDKLLSIARSDEDPQVRRRAIQRLSRSSDPRVVGALRDIVNQ